MRRDGGNQPDTKGDSNPGTAESAPSSHARVPPAQRRDMSDFLELDPGKHAPLMQPRDVTVEVSADNRREQHSPTSFRESRNGGAR